MVVAGSLGGFFQIRLLLALIQVEIGVEALSGTVVEVVLGVEAHRRVVRLAQVLHLLGLADGLVLTGHVVGHEVDDDLQASLMAACHQLFKLLHALFHVDSQVGVNVVVVGDGIRRTGLALHHGRMLAGNAIGCVVGLRGMADNAGIPHVGDAHGSDVLQHLRCEVVQLATAVLSNRSVRHAVDVTIAEKTCEYLINQNFIRCHER